MSRLILCASLWSLAGHPSPRREWTLARKLEAVREAGFAAVSGPPGLALTQQAGAHGLRRFSAFIAPDWPAVKTGLRDCAAERVARVNIQLGTPALTGQAACKLAVQTWRRAEALGLRSSFETHRGTATETPEKLTSLAARFAQATGRLLPVTWDFSHHAVVRQIPRQEWPQQLLRDRALITAADLFHLRPHTPHHVQVPLSQDRLLTTEAKAWLEFARTALHLWRSDPGNAGRELFVCPEMGPRGDYALASSPPAWPETVRLARHLRIAWRTVAS
ncbi:MAG: xylose isomerase [Rariglobus sp.]|nr:xylose isomerase [Rariglobus sp.]